MITMNERDGAKLLGIKRNKYGVSPKADRTYKGRVYASKREMQVFQELEIDPTISTIEHQPIFPLLVNGIKIGYYVADFRVTRKDVFEYVIEVKGHATPVWKLKEKLFRALYPDVNLRVIR